MLTLLHQLLSGLEHVHAHKLLHRDIKPANVLLSSLGVAKVVCVVWVGAMCMWVWVGATVCLL